MPALFEIQEPGEARAKEACSTGAVGIDLGTTNSLVAIVLGGATGAVLLATGRRGRKDPIPFGPFLAAGGAMALFWGERAFGWWMGGFGG